jgi:hypothetical protein
MSGGSPPSARSSSAAKFLLREELRRGEVVRRQLTGLPEVHLGLGQLPLALEQQGQMLVRVRPVLVVESRRVKASCASLKRQSSKSATAFS